MTARAGPDYRLWLACAAVKIAIFALAGRAYGYLSDELYFLDAAGHLALGYVDFPPAIAWVMAALTGLAGSDLLVLRGFACLVGILVTIISVEVARELGGGRLAQATTALVVLFAPAFLSVQSILTMNVLDQLWWAAGFWLLIRYLDTRESRYVYVLGVAFGLSLLTKLAMPAWFIALGVSVLVYARWTLTRKEVWHAIGLTILVSSPFLYWQIANDWPFFEFISAYNAEAAEAMVIDQPIFGLITTMNPPFLLIWLPGLIYGAIARDRTHRVLGTAAVVCLALFLTAGVKFYFATPLFILFTAFGGLLWERWLAERRRLAGAFLVSMAVSGVFSVPIAAPVLPPAHLQALADFIRDGEQGSPGSGPAPMGRYFPHFAEMHGWPELTARVTHHYESIPARERPGVSILAAFFGQAGAINQLDPEDRLPVAHSGHMAYHYWSEGATFHDVIAVGFELAELESLYREVEVLETFECERCMARENGLLIVRARDPAIDSAAIRGQIRRYYFF
jgi:hypothetical protein